MRRLPRASSRRRARRRTDRSADRFTAGRARYDNEPKSPGSPDMAARAPVDKDTLCINTIRTLSMDAVQAANSGHPGTPMALAPVAYYLWQRLLNFDPQDPIWPNRDRFVLSCGHASMLLY